MADTAGEKKEYWRWQESCWIDESKDWRAAKIVTAGIDVGSVSSQAVVCVDGELYGFNSMRTGNNSPDSARNAIQGVLDKSGMKLEDIKYVVGTGYGRVNVPFAHKAIT
ncbi:MAG: benzoyl-CoA reductase, bzd-type, subunit Q, partial [Rhodocyclaceae bacterium]|nr:benzoyl-CoA reductase, bzd-type, subunit Q [Rhodocyclaceae bacterium]